MEIGWNSPVFNYHKLPKRFWQAGHNMFNYDTCANIDWACVAPVITPRASVSKTSDGSLHGESASSVVQAYDVYKVKDISKKFPLEKSRSFSYPLADPKLNLSEAFHHLKKENYLYRQAGNAIDVVEFRGKTYVFSPGYCQKTKNILVSELVSRFQKRIGNCEKDLYCLKPHSRIATKSSDIVQLIVENVNGTMYVLSRSRNTVQHTTLTHMLRTDKNFRVNDFGSGTLINNQDYVSDIALSDTLPNFFAAALSNSTVLLYDNPNSTMKPIWKHHLSKDDKCVYQCQFGNHPCTLVVNNRGCVWNCDTRRKPTSQKSEPSQTMFNITEMRDYIGDQDILCKVLRSRRHHLYLVTSRSVLLMDERFCKVPVMKWEHSLSSFPSFTTKQTMKGYEFLIFGNCNDFQLCSLYQDLNTKHSNNSLSGLAKHYNFVQDTVQYAHSRNLWFTPDISRLNNKVMGLGSCVNPSDDSSLLLFSINNFEDIFLQELRVCDSNTDRAKSTLSEPTSDDRGEMILQEWEKELSLIRQRKLNNDDTAEAGCIDKEPIKPVSVVEFYKNLEELVESETDSLQEKKEIWSAQNYVINKYTDIDDVDIMKGDLNYDKRDLASYIPDDFSKYVDFSYLDKFSDSLSCAVRKLWQNTSNEEELTSASYYKVPLSSKRLKVLSEKIKKNSRKTEDCDLFISQEPSEISWDS